MKTTRSASDVSSTRRRFWIAWLTMAAALTCHVANSPRFRSWLASLAMAFALTSHVSAANENPKTNNVPQKSDKTALIDIAIETSRSQPAAGDGLGVSAEIKNLSDSVIHINADEMNLVLPPELEGPGKYAIGWYAMFPTETAPKDNPAWKAAISLKPGDTYKVFWQYGRRGNEDQSYFRKIYDVISSEMEFIFFPPGDYKIAVVCKYAVEQSPTPGPYRTTTQSAVIHVAAPQFVILFGAALGGLLAYFLLPQARKKLVEFSTPHQTRTARIVNRILKEFAGIAGAVLLSTMITILLSRISETQFLIKVTITDVWGAIAIGFVANYVGAKALDKILSGFSGQPNTSTTAQRSSHQHARSAPTPSATGSSHD